MKTISVIAEPATLHEISEIRDAFVRSVRCQIVRWSILPRRLAEPWIVRVGGEPVAYAGIWLEYTPGRIMEFFVAPEWRSESHRLFRAVIRASGASAVEWQSNLPFADTLSGMVDDPVVENDLFEDGPETVLELPGATFRARTPGDDEREGSLPEGPWVVERDGRVVGAGGVLTHYNPPYGDLYMEVVADARRQGVGAFLVNGLRRVAHEAELVPAARCDPSNEASRRTLLRAGMVRCGRLFSGEVLTALRGGGPAFPVPKGEGEDG